LKNLVSLERSNEEVRNVIQKIIKEYVGDFGIENESLLIIHLNIQKIRSSTNKSIKMKRHMISPEAGP
jgi:hypothetical protein